MSAHACNSARQHTPHDLHPVLLLDVWHIAKNSQSHDLNLSQWVLHTSTNHPTTLYVVCRILHHVGTICRCTKVLMSHHCDKNMECLLHLFKYSMLLNLPILHHSTPDYITEFANCKSDRKLQGNFLDTLVILTTASKYFLML
jgi:hypothetical protein